MNEHFRYIELTIRRRSFFLSSERQMKSLVGAVCFVLGVVAFLPTCARAADAEAGAQIKSELLKEGPFREIREPIEHIFQFVIEGGQLKLDRDAWEREAKEIEKESAEAESKPPVLPPGMNPNSPEGLRFQARQLELKSRQLEEKARETERMARAGPIPPLHLLFRKVQEKAVRRSNSYSGGGPGYNSRNGWVEFDSAFRTNALIADLRTNNDGEQLSFEENVSPQRAVDFIASNDGSFRIQLCDPQGDMVLMRQQATGQFDAVAMIDGKVTIGRGDSFIALFKRNQPLMETLVLPALASVGISPVLPPHDEQVRSTMYALLLRTPEAAAEGQQLLEDLDSDKREVRDRATRLLGNLFDRYKDLIQQKLQDKSSSAEVRSRLKNIVANEADSKLVRQTIAAFDLVNDPQYVVSFLDDADPKEFIKIVRHLEKISGQKLGTDPAVWKEWANSKASNN